MLCSYSHSMYQAIFTTQCNGWYQQLSWTSNFIVQQNIKAKSGASDPWWYYKWKFKFDVISWCHEGLCNMLIKICVQ